MLLRLRGSEKDGFSPPLRPSGFCLSGGAEQRPSRGSTKSGGCEGGRAAVKIRCLLGRSRLRRKRGRLFLRLGWRSQNERPATRLIGLTPLELFFECDCGEEVLNSPVLAPAEGDYEWQSTMWRLSEVVRAGMWRRSGRANLGSKWVWGGRDPSWVGR